MSGKPKDELFESLRYAHIRLATIDVPEGGKFENLARGYAGNVQDRSKANIDRFDRNGREVGCYREAVVYMGKRINQELTKVATHLLDTSPVLLADYDKLRGKARQATKDLEALERMAVRYGIVNDHTQ